MPPPRAPLTTPFRLVVAGSAGAKVRSAARLAASAGVLSGLHVTQRDDYPVTVKTGHCVSSLVLSPEEIHFSGIERPDVLVVLSDHGAAKAGRHASAMGDTDRVYAVRGVSLPPTRAQVVVLDPSEAATPLSPHQLSLYVLAVALLDRGVIAADALLAAAARVGNGHSEAALSAIRSASVR